MFKNLYLFSRCTFNFFCPFVLWNRI